MYQLLQVRVSTPHRPLKMAKNIEELSQLARNNAETHFLKHVTANCKACKISNGRYWIRTSDFHRVKMAL